MRVAGEFDELSRWLESPDPTERYAALVSLSAAGHDVGIAHLAAAAEDPDPRMRMLAFHSIARDGHAALVDLAVRSAAVDEDRMVRSAAAEALFALNHPSAASVYRALLREFIRHPKTGAPSTVSFEVPEGTMSLPGTRVLMELVDGFDKKFVTRVSQRLVDLDARDAVEDLKAALSQASFKDRIFLRSAIYQLEKSSR